MQFIPVGNEIQLNLMHSCKRWPRADFNEQQKESIPCDWIMLYIFFLVPQSKNATKWTHWKPLSFEYVAYLLWQSFWLKCYWWWWWWWCCKSTSDFLLCWFDEKCCNAIRSLTLKSDLFRILTVSVSLTTLPSIEFVFLICCERCTWARKSVSFVVNLLQYDKWQKQQQQNDIKNRNNIISTKCFFLLAHPVNVYKSFAPLMRAR